MERSLSKRIGRLEKSVAVDTVAIELEGVTFVLARAHLRDVLREISEVGADVGPGPSSHREQRTWDKNS
jgi:hypothetical protein